MDNESKHTTMMLPQGKCLTKTEMDSVFREVMTTSGYDDIWTFPKGYYDFVLTYGYCGHYLMMCPTKGEALTLEYYLYHCIQAAHEHDGRKPAFKLVTDTLEDEERRMQRAFNQLWCVRSEEQLAEMERGWDAYVTTAGRMATAFFTLSLTRPRKQWRKPQQDGAQEQPQKELTDTIPMNPFGNVYKDCTFYGGQSRSVQVTGGDNVEGDKHSPDIDIVMAAPPCQADGAPQETAPQEPQAAKPAGRPTEELFADKDTTTREAERLFTCFLDNDIDLSLNCSKSHRPNLFVAAFVQEWQRRGLVLKPVPARALARFLIHNCGMGHTMADPEKNYSKFIKHLVEQEVGSEVCAKVRTTFAESA